MREQLDCLAPAGKVFEVAVVGWAHAVRRCAVKSRANSSATSRCHHGRLGRSGDSLAAAPVAFRSRRVSPAASISASTLCVIAANPTAPHRYLPSTADFATRTARDVIYPGDFVRAPSFPCVKCHRVAATLGCWACIAGGQRMLRRGPFDPTPRAPAASNLRFAALRPRAYPSVDACDHVLVPQFGKRQVADVNSHFGQSQVTGSARQARQGGELHAVTLDPI